MFACMCVYEYVWASAFGEWKCISNSAVVNSALHLSENDEIKIQLIIEYDSDDAC